MKRIFVFIICLMFSLEFSAQSNNNSSLEKHTLEHFEKNYKKKNYKKFIGNITSNKKGVQFDDKTFLFDKDEDITKIILEKGLVYPQLLTDFQYDHFLKNNKDKSQKTFLKLQKNPKLAFGVNNVSIRFIETSYANENVFQKRYKIITKSALIPIVKYFIEFYNEKAVKEMSLNEFMEGARVTYLNLDQ